jgi:signal transduction histidine kinase
VKFLPRQKLYCILATLVLLAQAAVAALAKPSFRLTVFGDLVPCVLLLLAILTARENLRRDTGILPVFWKLFVAALTIFLSSQIYWSIYDWRGTPIGPTPITGDTLFLLAHILFIAALALRPHSAAAGHNLRIRLLDLIILSLWWLSLYAYFSVPWQLGIQDISQYTPSYYLLALIQHLVIIVALAILFLRSAGAWRFFYKCLFVAFGLLAAGNLLLNFAIDTDRYYTGSFYDTPFVFAIYLFTPIAALGSTLQPEPEITPNRELHHGVWTARLAMLGILSLPVIGFVGLYQQNLPPAVTTFRLRLVFAAMLPLGALVYWKFNRLARELRHLVQLTRESIENLNAVQEKVNYSEKLAALGRLAAGAAHEVSNPLTAIFGYSELLTDIPSLTPADRASAQLIQQQVHRAQDAVNSLRNSLRQNAPATSVVIDKKPSV